MMDLLNTPRPLGNTIFTPKAYGLYEKNISPAKIDLGARMHAKAVFDPGYFQRLHHDQLMTLMILRVLGTPVLHVPNCLGKEF